MRPSGSELNRLALFRILLGSYLALASCCLLPSLADFYSDEGVLPRYFLISESATWAWSLHWLNGSPAFVLLLHGMMLVAAVAFTLGWHTQCATALLWLLLVSLGARNPLVATPADALAQGWLFWCLFLPMGGRASVDAALVRSPATQYSMPAGISLRLWTLAPVGWLLAADQSLPWLMALGFIFLLPSRFWEVWRQWHVRRHPGELRLYYSHDCDACHKSAKLLGLMLGLRLTILSAHESPRARTLMEFNTSPWIVVDSTDEAHMGWAGFIALLRASPIWGWTTLLPSIPALQRGGNWLCSHVSLRQEALSRFSARILPWRDTHPHAPFGKLIVWPLLLAATAWHAGAPAGWLPPGAAQALPVGLGVLGLDSPGFRPPKRLPGEKLSWYIAPAVQADGRLADLLNPGQPINYEAAPQPLSLRWQLWGDRLNQQRNTAYRAHWADRLCWQWNLQAQPQQRAQSIKLIRLSQRGTQMEQQVLWRQDCKSS